MEDNKRKLYDALSKDYDLGTFEQFESDISDAGKRRKLYDATINEYDYGDYSSFEKQLGFGVEAKQQPKQEEVSPSPTVDKSQYTLTADEVENEAEVKKEVKTPDTVRSEVSTARANFAKLDKEAKIKALEDIFGMPMSEIRSNYYNSIDRKYNPDEEYDDYDAIFNYATGGDSYDDEDTESSTELTAFRDKRNRRLKEYGGYSENEIMAGVADEETTQRYLKAQNRNAAKEQLVALERDVNAGIENIRADYYEDHDGVFDKIVDWLNPVDVEEFAISKDAQEIIAARNLLKEAREVMETVEDDKNFGEKAWDAIKNWSPINAFAGVADAARIYDLAEKFERGEELTSSELMLMDALAINTAIHGLYANDITFDQKAGQVVGEMLPLAIEMFANPLSGTAKSATKSLAKYMSKRIANKATRRALTYTTGAAVSALAGYGMAATTGAPRTIAGTIDRMTGDAQVETDEDGNVVVTGFENGDNFGEALVKEWSANAIDYATEIAGAEWAGKGLGWLGKKIPGGKWADDMMTTLGNTKLGRAYKAFQEATHIKGSLEEFIEEWEAHELNRATIGDNEESFFSGDNAITTALAVSVVPATVGGINAVTGMFTGAYKAGAAEKYKMMNAYSRAMELWGDEWQSVGTVLGNADPEFIEQELKSIYNSDQYTDEQKRVALEFACHSLSYQTKRGVIDAMSDERTRMLNDMLGGRYEEGYNTADEQMHEVKKAWFVERERALETLGKDVVEKIDDDAVLALSLMDVVERAKAMDYVNALMRYDGMIQRVRDDIVGRIEQSDKLVDARTNRDSGMIQPATLKVDDRRVYVVSGNVVQYEDGSGIDNNASDGSIIIQDAESGEIEMISPDAILNIDEALDPINEKMVAAETIRMQFAQEAAAKIDNPIVIIGDETDSPIIPVDSEEELQEENRPQYNLNDTVSLTDENGSTVRGSITTDADADGRYEVYTEAPINGKRVNLFTRDELDSMLIEHNGVVFEQPADNEDNNGGENIPESGNNTPQNIGSADLTIPAMQRIPKDMQGNPLYEQTDSDTAWDAIVEQTEGDEAMAQTVADGMVADKEAALKKLEKAKSKGGATIAEKIAAEKERLAAIEAARQELAIWQKIAGTLSRRKMEAEAERRRVADEAAALRKAEEERLRAEREEAERIEREALNGVPDIVDDTPQDARARGYRRVSGHKIDRQEPVQGLQGKEVAVRFSDDAIANGRVAVIDATQLQPSHIQGVRNPLHFIDEAQPKERNDEASVMSARKIAGNIRPEEITSSVTAYTGAPTVNARGEAIQGNNRSDALRLMWESHEDQAAQYKQYLIDHADEFGLNADDVAAMERPVLVNMLDVDDAEAITLGQFVAQDTESGGTERIKPKNALQKIGNDMRSFANLLLKSNDEDTSFAGLVDNNGVEVLKWMSQRGYINPTQYKSAFDSKGNLTAEAKNDLRGIMYQSIFKGGSTRLEEMFNAMPAKAQKAILATAFRDYDSHNADRMIEEIQNSIRAFYALSQSEDFVNAKTFKDARLAVEGWKIQYQIDDVTGESYLPAENFSNFALLLATMYKGENQSVIQGTFNKLYDLIQGTQEPNLFEQPDNTPRSLAQAIYETLNITYDGQQRSNVLVGDSSASQRGQQGSTGDAATGERIESGERTADSAGSIEAESTTGDETVHQPQPERKGLEQTPDGGRETDGTGVADDATQEVLGASNRGDIRVFEEGLDTSYREYSEYSERTRRTTESERLVSLAKQHGLFIPAEVIKTLTGKVAKRTGESVVYIDTAAGKVTKVKDPYAKSAMKSGVQPEDAAFEHLVHNLLFPETAYTLEGISEEMGDVRIVLSQDFIQNYEQPTKEQIAEALAARGLFPEDNYSFGNELVSVTDVEGDNVLLGEDGTVYFIDPIIRLKKPLREILAALDGAEQNAPTIGEQIQAAEAEVNTNPTEAQKEAGNYKKGHVQIGTFNVTIEQPKGSVRSGVDKGGKKWEVEMQNTYGYIRGTEGVDGDHIDVFLSDDIDGWDGHKVFVVDQRNADGSFDEHKVMLGFNDINDAETAYMSNYEEGWQGLGAITGVSIEEFEKWIASSHRKTKAFAEYKSVKTTEGQSASNVKEHKLDNLADWFEGDVVRDYYTKKLYRIKKHSRNGVTTIAELDAEGNEVGAMTINAHNNRKYEIVDANHTPTISQESDQDNDAPYSIAPAQYTTKKGKVLDMYLVKIPTELNSKQSRVANSIVRNEYKGWWDKEQGGFMMRSEEDAIRFGEYLADLASQEPVELVSMDDIKAVNNGDVAFTEPKQENERIWQYSIHIDADGYTTISRDDVSSGYPIGDARFRHSTNSPEEMLDILRNPLNGMQEALEAVGVTLENKIKTRELDQKMKSDELSKIIFSSAFKDLVSEDGKHNLRITKVDGAKRIVTANLNTENVGGDGLELSFEEIANILNNENWQEKKDEAATSGNRLVTDERYAELRERMRKKLGGQMNIGIDPEILAIGTEMAVYHLEKGARKFTEFAKAMVADLGDVIRPYLKAFYNGARNLPEVESSEIATDMTSYDEVQTFDIANFDKPGIDAIATAETVTREAEVIQEVEVAQERIKKSRSQHKKSEKKAVNLQQSDELGLFDGLIDNETNNEDGLQRTDAERSGGVSANGNRHEQGLSRGSETGSESEQQDSRGTDLGGERTGDAVDRTVRPRLSDTIEDKGIEGKRKKDVENNRKLADELKGVTLFVPDTFGVEHELSGFTYYELENVFHFTDNIDGQRNATRKELDAILKIARKNNGKEEISEPKNTRNNHSERGKDHAPTSVDARIEANIKAIELAKQLLESGEQATEKQMQTLRKFSGWGGLGKAFNEGTSYAPNRISKQIRELLGEAAYQEAVMSANSAYYTPAYVVDTLWDIAEQMGFKGGNILEGSAGIGNILGQMPTHISERSDIHAIEIDGTSGGILSLLYPDAKVEIQGFEETRIANGSVDLAITNVPFVTGLRVNDTTGDKDLSKKFHNIHDFCIAKNVRKLREGGLGIFITSNGTLDNSKKLRDWIVSEGGADFVGAFRMHNKTFGGTGVTSDIIVIRKRVNGKKSANAIDVSTVTGERMAEYETGETRKVKGKETPVIKQLSMDYNRYFVEHPENMAGEMHFAFEKGDTFRPTSKGLYPKQDKKQEQMLAEFVQSFTAEEFGDKATDSEDVIDAMPGKKIGEVFVKDGKLYINAIGAAQPLEVNANKVKGHTKVECFEAYSAIKEALAAVLEYQINHEDDKGLKPLLAKLNKAYDDFVATYGHFNKNTAIAFLRNDVDYASVFALEKFEESADAKGNKVQKFGKTDVFSKRVIEKEAEPMPTNVKDGIVASIFKFGRVDIPYIAEQLGKSEAEIKAEIIESGYGFEDPATRQVEVSYQYLSGNVREKLRQAQENNENGEFDRNIKALQEVMPMTIPARLIDFTLGSSWIEPKMYEEYVKERTEVGVQFTAVGGTWFMNEPYFTNYEKNRAMGVTSEMLGRTVMGHTLIEAAIQNRTITVSTVKKNWDGSTETITDKEATQACSAKIDEIRQDFKEWARQKMQSDAEMSERMERVYNDTFNNYVPMSIPDEFVPEYFGGASHKFKMRSHQGKAIVRGTMQPLLLAHEVGTGKTFTLISTAMEMRRLGTARKPMIVVQNATVGQFVASAKELYPNAKILTLEEADRSVEGRKNFYAKIKYNDWDMIVVPQSTFEFIPDSEERQMTFVQEKIEEKMLVLEQMKEADPDGKSMITRQAEREIALLEEELAGLSGETGKKRTANDEKKRAVALQNAEVKAMEMLDRRTDDVENFDDMGIDALLIDEAHEYKHLGFATAMQRGVKGVDPSYSKKSQGVFLKTQAVLEKNNGRNVIFATGTPISNTAAEIWTFMRYLMPADTMKEYGIYYFDDFVRNFGNIQQMLEFTTSGKFKENNRFAGYVNLPELVRIWSGVSDTVLTKEAGGVSDKIPDMEGGKAQDLYLPQTRALRSIMKYVKAELERYDQMSGKQKKENSHIPLTMYGIAKAAAVDARLVQSDAEDDAQSKTNEAVRQTLRSLKESADYKGTVAIFADNYQNKESGFNLYEDIRTKLIAEGVPADEIVVIKSGMTVKKKLEIFEKVNRGEVRVILGSTFTLGTGVNIQERLYTLIHLDAPNRPMDYTQRNGRILRQGNLHKAMGKPVRVLRFGVEDSLDVTAYQRLKTKGAIADSIMNGKQMMANSMTNRVLEEEEDVFGDTVAQLSGSEYAMLKNNAEKNVRKYASRKKQWEADQTYIHNAKPKIKGNIKDAEKRIEDNSRYLEAVRASFPDGKFKEIVIGKHRFATIEAMEEFFKEHNKSVLAEMKQMKDGEIAGEQKRELTIQIGGFSFKVKTLLTKETKQSGMTLFTEAHKSMTYSCPELDIEDCPVHQQLLRNAVEDIVTNVITGKDFAERLEIAERVKKHNEAELEQLLSREGKPFEYEAELEQAQAQYEEFSELMKKELEEKEAKYAEMDATVEAANDLANAEEAEEFQREGEGMLSDRDVVMESDPYSKVLGRPRYYGKRQREYATRQRDRMARKAEQIADLLGIEIDVYDTADELNGKRAKAKGWFNPKTGKIAIVVSNHGSTGDIIETVLHEGVAHYGLRKLFGKHFDTFLDNVYNNVSYDIREKIVELAKGHNWDFRRATEEYLASLAENTNFEKVNPSLWSNIKSFFIKMLTKVGITLNEPLSDNELRYILWRSYQNLVNPGWFNVYGQAEDVSMQYSLSVGNYAEDAADTDIAADSNEDDLLMREGYSGYMINGELVPDKYVHAINHSANWRKKHKGAARCIVIQSGETLRTRLERAGFPQEKIDIAENMYNDGTLAAYFPVQDMVVIFNTDASESEIIGYLWHENAHRAIDRLYTQEEIETLFKNIVGKFEQDIREGLAEMGYEEDKQAEEFLVRMLEDLYLAHPEFAESGKFKFPEDENVNTKLLADVIKPLINFINNGNREEARRDATRRLGDRGFRLIYDKTKGGETVEVRNSEAESVRGEAAPKAKRGEPEARIRAEARNRYERRVKSGMFQSREALQDSMLGLKEAMQAILGKGTNIEEVDGFENAYLGENRLSSVNKAEADAFAHTLFKPMLDEVAKLARNKEGREELTDYMMAKHGLERNEYMRNEAIKNGATDADQTDYAGLTALTGMDNVADAEAEAQRMVDEYENAHDTADLWEKVNAVSKAILQKSYECGMMSKETFDKVSNMYEFYIPLRGFDEKTSNEAYAYLTHKHSAFNAPIKKAEGRRSKADDPFANLQSMAEGAIMQGNRNKLVKQRFLNFALNHPSDLVSVSDLWVEYDAVTDEWKPVFPDNIDSTDTPEEVEQKMQDFETKMESLAQQHPDQYKHGKDAINIPYRIVESRDMRQHQVIVKRGGRDYVITINGNPRAAQALNGQTNPDNDMSGAIGAILRAGEKINRQLSAFYTTRNPDFIVSNFMRDLLYTNTMTWIKESPNYARRFHRNYLMVNPVKMKRLLARYRKGTLDMSDKTDAMFQQFMMNGGETGYANIRDIEKHKNDIKRELKKSNGRITIQRAWDFLTELFDELNRAVENCARFAAFITSREMGRSIDRAIYDAKEISVNFNKKGSGAKFYDSTGQTRTGNASALVSGLGRSAYVFWNAAIQGTTNFGRQVKHHPAKALTGMATMFLLGAIVAYLGGDDDEDDKNAYYNLPEYVRRSNILFRAGDSWISIPLPIEYRAIYGMGELMTSVLSGKEHFTDGEIAEAVAAQMTQVLPLDFLEGDGGLNAFVPSAAKPLWEAYVAEKSWTGMPLYKDTPYNKNMPEWTKAYKSANKHIVNLAATLNEATGGDPYTKGTIDFNPAKVEYVLNGYFGGAFGTIDKLVKMGETWFGDREYDPRSFLLVNRLVKAGDERTEYRAVNNEYFRLKEEHDQLKTRLKHYEEDTDNGIFDYAEKIDFLYNSPEYERYEIFEEYRKDIDDLYDELKEAVNDEERKEIEAELNELKKEMIQEMNLTRGRK